jgi:hypothetical protein
MAEMRMARQEARHTGQGHKPWVGWRQDVDVEETTPVLEYGPLAVNHVQRSDARYRASRDVLTDSGAVVLALSASAMADDSFALTAAASSHAPRLPLRQRRSKSLSIIAPSSAVGACSRGLSGCAEIGGAANTAVRTVRAKRMNLLLENRYLQVERAGQVIVPFKNGVSAPVGRIA